MKSIKNLQNNFIKFHGCGLYRKDGTNVLCTKKRPCLKPINNCFWMKSKDTTNKIRTRNKELNDEMLMSNSLKNEYFQKLYIMKHRQYYSSDESFIRIQIRIQAFQIQIQTFQIQIQIQTNL